MSTNPDDRRERQISRDRETIREWAQEHGTVPVRETATEGETDRFRMVPEEQVGESHERVEWNDFFDQLDEGDHVVVYHGTEASEPLEIAGQRDVASQIDDEEIEERLLKGETVTSTITETAVVESVVVEETTVESELVDSEIVDEQVLDADLVGRECTSCEFVEDRTVDTRSWFDVERYFDVIGEGRSRETTEGTTVDRTQIEAPYHAELDVEETWSVTRQFAERFVVESHIVDSEVTGADTIEDYDIDVSGLHRSIAEREIVGKHHAADEELPPSEILTQYDVESELAEADRITTTFTRDRTVEDEVVERKRLTADITDSEGIETEVVRTESVPPGEGATEDVGAAGESVTVNEEAKGKPVVDASGEKVGMVSDVQEDQGLLIVDADPSITERIKAALGWGDADEEDYHLGADQVRRITDDGVELKRSEHLGESVRRS